ncbi:polysaccharide pyruvyl transferase family protein [Brevibacillus sp. Leaf182]|uniref:polysaccharide pyruvyl transferase family protein n=1 Tax=Brevibacillus sp. Leaf182 TaxID=1736290 RepID=UPI0006FEF96D|nr:polysaccharide pyruvyl transferase family protein [Brevibacillus sp. Leaf182]RAT98744.1 polysaccharide pyruvyl transferase family protein [Brevibacillus sp. Leaf182]
MNRVAILTECKPYNPNRTFTEQLNSVGGNTGNNAYITALMDIFSAVRVDYELLDKALEDDEYDVYIVGNLSWIVEDTPLPDFYYDAFRKIISKGKKFVPISVGTQVFDYKADFKYDPTTLSFLKEISEQAVIACRGEYTAEVLSSNGVKNVEVIGCPSLFHTKDPNFKLSKRNYLRKNPRIATGITPWPNEKMSTSLVKEYLGYAIRNKIDFIEQADNSWIEFLSETDKSFKGLFHTYFKRFGKMFFDIEEWRAYSRELDFSFSGRFHGNVIPLLEGVPSLFISIDARTKEMCEYFKFPTIDIQEFCFDKTLEELYEMADYTEFNKSYSDAFIKFENYVKKNNLKIVK